MNMVYNFKTSLQNLAAGVDIRNDCLELRFIFRYQYDQYDGCCSDCELHWEGGDVINLSLSTESEDCESVTSCEDCESEISCEDCEPVKSCEDCDSWCVLAMDCRWRKNLLECSFKIMQCVPYFKKIQFM